MVALCVKREMRYGSERLTALYVAADDRVRFLLMHFAVEYGRKGLGA